MLKIKNVKKACYLILLITQISIAQTVTDLRPQVKSPEVNKFEQYINMPVNLASGTPEVKIPIYTLEYAGMTLPISLDYDASGVKVESIASTVGQNWSLNVGGVVSRIIKGAPDEGNPYNWQASSSVDVDGYYQDYGLTKLETSLNTFANNTYNLYSGGSYSNRSIQFSKWLNDISNGYKDSQPDLFYFSTPQGGSKFVFNDQRQIVYLENTDFIIKENFSSNDFRSWFVRSPNGIKYKFGIEFPTGYQGRGNVCEASYNLSEGPFDGIGGDVNRYLVNSWFLTEISNYTNPEKILINYIDNDYKQIVNNSQSKYAQECINYSNGATSSGCNSAESLYFDFSSTPFDINNGSSANMQNRPISSYIVHSKVIEKIIAGNTEIIFIYSNRNDLIAYTTFESISPKRLTQIQILNKGVCIKKFLFNYSETFSSESSSNINVTNIERKRYFLTKLEEKDCAESTVKPYVFEYDSTLLPNRLSYAQDMWGYYNGKTTNLSMFSKFNIFSNSNVFTSDRSLDLNYAKAGSLIKIIYPTKGTVNFEYESHQSNEITDYRFEPTPISTLTSIQPQPQGLFTSPSNQYSFVYNLPSNQALMLTTTLMFPSFQFSTPPYYCQPSSSNAVEIRNSSGQLIYSISYSELQHTTPETKISKTVKKIFNPTLFQSGQTYTIKVFGFTDCYHNMTTLTSHVITPLYETGGLRIKKVTHKNYDNSIAKEMNYEYQNPKLLSSIQKGFKINYSRPENYSSLNGLLSYNNISYLLQYEVDRSLIESMYQYNSPSYLYYISSGQNIDDFNFIGPHICYGKVIEYNGIGNGKIEYNFNQYRTYNEINPITYPLIYPRKPIIQSSLGGEKSNQLTWSASNEIISTERNEFNYTTSNTTVKGLRTLSYGASFQSPGILFNSYTISGQIKTLKTEVESSNLNGQSVTTQKDYEYNGNGHFQPTKITSTNSKGEVIETKIKYPQDLPNELFMSDLILQNRKTPVVTENYLGNTKTFEQRTTFLKDASTSNYVLPKSVYAAKFPNDLPSIAVFGQLEKRVTSDSYDASGNLTQFTPEGGIPVSIIWGYNNTLPIAKIENVTYASIPASSITNLQSLSSTGTEADLIVALNNLRTSLPNAMITTYTHKPLIGVSSVTDTKGDVQSYHYDSFNRLQYVKDKDGNILSENQYHYKN